ncbi:MAG TPA: hypothetical protein V6D20_03990 [Candidatus Obscuribacterales bacterium]
MNVSTALMTVLSKEIAMHSPTHDAQALLEQDRQRLETSLHQKADCIDDRPSRLRQFLNGVGQALVNWLIQEDIPRIHRFIGETEVWKVYDPSDRSTHYFDREDDVRVYLERRYYL